MNSEELKTICREEFGVVQFSKPECFSKMEKVFGVPGRTFQNWIHTDKVRPYFDKALGMYFENKRLNLELSRLTQEFFKISKRLDSIYLIKPTEPADR